MTTPVFTTTEWHDAPGALDTPLDAENLNDLEARVAGGFNTLVPRSVGPVGPGADPLYSRVADFEPGNFSQVDGVGAESSTVSTVTIDVSVVHSGTKSAKLHVPGGGGVGYARTFYEYDGAANLGEGSEVWGEVAIWLPSNWTTVKQSSVDFLRWDSYVSDDGATLWPSNTAAFVAVTQFSNAGGDVVYLKAALKDDTAQSLLVGPLPPTVLVSGWNVIQAHVIFSVSPGAALGELWINGAKQGSSAQRTLYGTHPINRLRGGLVATGGGQTSTLDVWMDDFKAGVGSDPATAAQGITIGSRKLWDTGTGLTLNGSLLLSGSLAATTAGLVDTAKTSLALAGGVTFGGDTLTNFYRTASGIIASDGGLRLGGELRVQTGLAGEVRVGSASGSGTIDFVSGAGAAVDGTIRRWATKQIGTSDTAWLFQRTNATDIAFDATSAAATVSPLRVYANGQIELGDGTNSRDVRLKSQGASAETLAVRDVADTQYRDARVRNFIVQRLVTRPRYTASRTAAGLSIPNAAWTTVDIDLVAANSDSALGDVVQASLVGDYVQIMRACLVIATGVFRFAAGTTGNRGAAILHQDSTSTTKGLYPSVLPAAVSTCAVATVQLECAANDRILLQAYQDSGAGLGPVAVGQDNVALRVLPAAA